MELLAEFPWHQKLMLTPILQQELASLFQVGLFSLQTVKGLRVENKVSALQSLGKIPSAT